MDLLIERAKGSDWPAIRELCCRTADGGKGVPEERWPFFGEYWVGPYEALLPGWAYAARSGERLAGYLTGCPDSLGYQARAWLAHRVPLFIRAARKDFGESPDAKRFLARFLGLDPFPFGPVFLYKLYRAYPAHLHVNVEAGFRGKGVGKALVDRFLEDLRGRACPGVHLFCGPGPVPFYRKLGLEPCAETIKRGRPVFCLVRRLG